MNFLELMAQQLGEPDPRKSREDEATAKRLKQIKELLKTCATVYTSTAYDQKVIHSLAAEGYDMTEVREIYKTLAKNALRLAYISIELLERQPLDDVVLDDQES